MLPVLGPFCMGKCVSILKPGEGAMMSEMHQTVAKELHEHL